MSVDDAINQVRNALSSVPYFTRLDPALIETIARQMKIEHFDAGQVVFLEGDRDVALNVVHTGWLKAVKTSPDGREQRTDFAVHRSRRSL